MLDSPTPVELVLSLSKGLSKPAWVRTFVER